MVNWTPWSQLKFRCPMLLWIQATGKEQASNSWALLVLTQTLTGWLTRCSELWWKEFWVSEMLLSSLGTFWSTRRQDSRGKQNRVRKAVCSLETHTSTRSLWVPLLFPLSFSSLGRCVTACPSSSASWLGPHAAVLSREQTATQPSAKTQPMAKNLSLHYVPRFHCLETRDKGSDDLPQVMTQIILIICKVWVVSWDRGYRKFSFFLRSLGWRHIE